MNPGPRARRTPAAKPAEPKPDTKVDDSAWLEERQAERARQRELVPWIGSMWRWYDIPWRILHGTLINRRWWMKLPRGLRTAVNDAINRLMLYNSLERARVSSGDDSVFNLIVPEHEQIEIPAIWVVEYFSPAYIPDLDKRLRKWPTTRFASRPEEVAKEQLRRARERSGGGSMSIIGSFVSIDSKSWDPGAQRAKLPEGIEAINVQMFSMGSALTAVVAEFHLTAEASLSVDRAARQRHEPRIVQGADRPLLDDALFVGIHDVQAERDRLHTLARSWMATRLPGLFAVEGNKKHPVLDVVLTHAYDPFAVHGGREIGSNLYRALFGMYHTGWDQIVSPDWPGVVFDSYRGERGLQEDDGQWQVIAKWEDVFPSGNLYFNGERSTHGIVNALGGDWEASGLLSRLGLFSVLWLKERRGAVARDLASQTHSGARPVKSIKKLRASVLRSSLDLSSIARDIDSITSSRKAYEWNLPRMWSQPGPNADAKHKEEPADKEMLKNWSTRQAKSAKRLLQIDSSITTLLGVVASLTSSIEGIRSQRWSIAVAALSLLAAVAAVVIAVVALIQPPTP